MQRKKVSSLKLILPFSLASLFLLSVLSNILTPEPILTPGHTNRDRQTQRGREAEQPSLLLFQVSPVTPRLFWSVSTADYYTGFNWLRTTDENILEKLPQLHDANATKIFTVEIDTTRKEIPLPTASPNSTPANVSLVPFERSSFHMDTVGNVYEVVRLGQSKAVKLVYNVAWCETEIDDRLVSLTDIPEEIQEKYLQLPNISNEVWELAENLTNPSYSVSDQILADVQYLRTNFIYDSERSQNLLTGTIQGSDVASYIETRKGICIDSATALAIILRIQKIPARISIGYNPGRTEGNKLLYFTSGAHALTEAYLPPYGWTQFDATPPLEENPLVKVLPFKKESSPGGKLFFQLSITNRINLTDNFRLFVDSKRKWDIEIAPEKLWIEAFQTADALLGVTIPNDAALGEKDIMTITVASPSRPEIAFSILAIAQVENTLQVPTTTFLENTDETATRGDTFWVNGTVRTTSQEQIDDMPVFVFLTKSNEAEGMIIGKGYTRQGSFHIESAVPYFVEIGDYKVIPISLGTTQYAPSSTPSTVKVCAATRMEIDSEENLLLNYGTIHGRLFWDNKTGLADARISLKLTSLADHLEIRKMQNLTFKDGSFNIATTFGNPGVYEVEAVYTGNEYALESNATHVVTLKRGIPAIQILSENVAIRGEIFNLTGVIRFEDVEVRGEPVTVAFDNRLLTTVETRENGSYSWSFPVGSEEKLGAHIVTVALQGENISEVHSVIVKSKTTLTTKASSVMAGMSLWFSASLSDDHDMPIQGAEITIDNYGLSWRTDNNGNVAFLLDTPKLLPGNLTLTARFEGSDSYLPDKTKREIPFEPVSTLPFLVPLVSPTLVVIAVMYAKYHVKRQQTGRMEVVSEEALAKEGLVPQIHTKAPLQIAFPDIGHSFPNVWGVEENLRIGVTLDESAWEKVTKKEVEVAIDEEIAGSLDLSQQGRGELSHAFTIKGEHKVQAILQRTLSLRPWSAQVTLCVVDYGEEIIRLYKKFLEKLTNYDVHARDEMTAREIESLILKTNDFSSEALLNVTTCFEKALYSNHLATRKDYQIMYIALKKLSVNIEQEN